MLKRDLFASANQRLETVQRKRKALGLNDILHEHLMEGGGERSEGKENNGILLEHFMQKRQVTPNRMDRKRKGKRGMCSRRPTCINFTWAVASPRCGLIVCESRSCLSRALKALDKKNAASLSILINSFPFFPLLSSFLPLALHFTRELCRKRRAL